MVATRPPKSSWARDALNSRASSDGIPWMNSDSVLRTVVEIPQLKKSSVRSWRPPAACTEGSVIHSGMSVAF